MRYIKTFETYTPDSKDVEKILKFIKNKYSIETTNIADMEMKYIIIGGKMYFLNSKKYLKNKLFLEIKDDLKEYSDASIKRAIKDFIL